MWEIILDSSVLGIIISGVGSFLFYLYKKKEEDFPKYFENVSSVYDTLNELMIEVKPSRILLLCAHNGGGIPQVGKPFFSTILHEVVRDLDPGKKSWQNQPLDQAYIKILSEMYMSDMYTIRTEDMETSILKNLYLDVGIQQSILVKIGVHQKKLYFLSLNFCDNEAHSLPQAFNKIRITIQRLSKLFLKK